MQFPLLLIGGLGTGELLVIILIFLVLFGAHKIPQLARSLGRAQREFQRARDEIEDEAKPPPASEDDRIRRAARDLGISTEGQSVEELRAAIAAKMGAASTPPTGA